MDLKEQLSGTKAGLQEKWNQVTDWLDEQDWFQELKGRWDELDTQVQDISRYSLVGLVLLFVGICFLLLFC